MAQPERIRRAPPTAADIACDLLRAQQRPLHFRELCEAILRRRVEEGYEPVHLARIYTDLNLDHRLVFLGDGSWGLREWHHQRVTRSLPAHSARPARKEPPWREEIEHIPEEGELPEEEEEESEDEGQEDEEMEEVEETEEAEDTNWDAPPGEET
ncbi:MAG TPA: DNA-directed RNA polymerase subunit delta [Firmicutes bacterium]|nr:DNA-directed RNA polymerase subunit delta [Bacillota bacterium]